MAKEPAGKDHASGVTMHEALCAAYTDFLILQEDPEFIPEEDIPWESSRINIEKIHDHLRLRGVLPSGSVLIDTRLASQEDYVEGGASTCPVCYNNNLVAGEPKLGDTSISVRVHCEDCKATWRDNYQMQGYEELEKDAWKS